MVGFDTFYLCVKFDDTSLNRSRDIIETPKFKVGRVTPDLAPFKVHLSSVCWDLT